MKRTIIPAIFILFSSVTAFWIYSFNKQRYVSENTKSKTFFTQPNDMLLYQRTYPYEKFDFEAYRLAVYQSKQIDIANKMNVSASVPWTVEGPGNIGGRFNCTAVDPGNSSIIYAGSALGGIFKTTNGGTTWQPIFDNQPFLSIGCITFNPQNTKTIWAGTGDVNISGYCYVGDGIYRSRDGGGTWTHMGLSNEYIVSQIVVDPIDSNIIYAATMGQPFQRDTARGLYKSVDGGNTWNKILYINNETGVVDLVMDPSNRFTLYAASYTRIRTYSESVAYSNNCRIWKTTNGGANWTLLTNGLPNYPVSRIGLAISSSNPNLLYTVIVDSLFDMDGIYKSTDAGASWNSLNVDSLNYKKIYYNFGWYFGKIYINPANNNQIYVPGVELYTTLNDGTSWTRAMPPWYYYQVHADQHCMSFINGNTIILSTDGGLYKTTNNCANWTDIENIPVTQFYRVTTNPTAFGDYWGGAQDNGTMRGQASSFNNWQREGGGDGFKCFLEPTSSGIYYYESQWGNMNCYDPSIPADFDFTTGIDTSDRRYWDFPYLMSPNDYTTFYCGTNKVYKHHYAPYGTWDSISSDLTKGWNGTGLKQVHTITCLDESSIDPGRLYIGTGDGNVWYTPDTGSTWNNIVNTLPDRYVTSIKASPNVLGNVYVTHSGYRLGDNTPLIHKSTNNGSLWTAISGNLPQAAINDVLIYPGNENILFCATDVGVYFTTDAGATWARLGNNMPSFPVFDIEYDAASDELIAGTYARSMWNIDLSFLASVKEENFGTSIQIYPNPSSDFVTVVAENNLIETRIFVYDIKGRLVKSALYVNDSHMYLDIRNLDAGSYFVNIKSGKNSVSKKIIKI